MSAVEDQSISLHHSRVGSMNYEENRRFPGPRGGGASSRGRGRRPQSSSGDVRVLDREIPVHESEQVRSDTYPRRGFDNRRGSRRGGGGFEGGRGRDRRGGGSNSNVEERNLEEAVRELAPPSRDGIVTGDTGEARDQYNERRGGNRRTGGRFRGRGESGNWRRTNEPGSESDSSQLSERRPTPNISISKQEKGRRTEVARPKDMAHMPQLVQELETKLQTGKIECMICYDNVHRNSPVWSCASCYSIFHLPCVRKWARAPTSSDLSVTATGNGEANWRCPGCQAVQMSAANELQYYCFCGQVREPTLDYYITPHSCGGPCRKPLDKSKSGYCKHICTLQCHPGPCPPCTALAPPQPCPCGKTTTSRKCSEQGKDARSCGQQCGRPLACGRHECLQVCHEGACQPCSVRFEANCFCGRRNESLQCWQVEPPGKMNLEAGVFSCEMECPKTLPCGNHMCGNNCHPGACGECEFSPSAVRTCPCGKKNLRDLQAGGIERRTCTDPIPTCQQTCGKILPCKMHSCRALCHSGPCPACEVPVEQKCRCGASTQRAACYSTLEDNTTEEDDLFLCDRKCGQMRSCGRHRCNDRCCPAANIKPGSHLYGDATRDPHLCMLPCGKKLRCKQHSCQKLCHPGHCPPCMETTFTELSCACGRTSIPPPVPCGTPLPSCQYPCSVPQVCGHEATHLCHFGDCPPCTVAVAKECVGNHVVLRGVPCGSRDIKCNKLCGKTRQCGLHACERPCHLPPCDTGSSSSSCGQHCGAPRRHCSHTCAAPCHPTSQCPEIACKVMVHITCSCGRLTAEVACGAGGSISQTNMVFSRLPAPLQPDKEKVPLGQRRMQCDDDCAKLEKKRLLADAFGATVPGEAVPGVEGGVVGSELLAETIRRDPQWVAAIEDRFKYLVQGPKTGTGPGGSIRLHVFAAMIKERREVIYQMAERWGLAVAGHGREPRRFVIVHVTSKAKVPVRSLLSKMGATGPVRAPPFNAQVDMEPGLVVGLLDLPREADVSTLVLRFGGECELVWLNDKNALAIFADGARAATALRRVDHASEYRGATTLPVEASSSSRAVWGIQTALPAKTTAFRKGRQDSNWVEDAWDDQREAKQEVGAWQTKVLPMSTSQNPWGALSNGNAADRPSTSSSNVVRNPAPAPARVATAPSASALAGPSTFTLPALLPDGDDDDWEKAL